MLRGVDGRQLPVTPLGSFTVQKAPIGMLNAESAYELKVSVTSLPSGSTADDDSVGFHDPAVKTPLTCVASLMDGVTGVFG